MSLFHCHKIDFYSTISQPLVPGQAEKLQVEGGVTADVLSGSSITFVPVCSSHLHFLTPPPPLPLPPLPQGGLSSVARVQVSVVDINDNRPTFYPVLYTVSLSAHSAPGTSVVKVTANDPDAGENGRVTYRTVPGGGSNYFTLNKDTGV